MVAMGLSQKSWDGLLNAARPLLARAAREIRRLMGQSGQYGGVLNALLRQ